MKESIYTIPISEVFEPMCGCPLCSLNNTLNERWVDYITGAAMMEPDVRIETNRHGFCERHFGMMLEGHSSRLSVALILQTRLAWVDESFNRPQSKPGRGLGALKGNVEHIDGGGCFVCKKIDNEEKRIASNIAAVWGRESDFRKLYERQEFMCYNHAKLLLTAAEGVLKKETLAAFREATASLTRKRLRAIKADIDSFCNLFDYRNAGSPHPGKDVATSVERAIAFFISRSTDDTHTGGSTQE